MSADICVIVPTVRNPGCVRSYVENARVHGFDLDRLFVLLVTEDRCDTASMREMLDDLGIDGIVADGRVRRRWLSDHDILEFDHLIPVDSHAQTSFGLLYMWANPRFEVGCFIDDDTRPLPEWDFFGRHLDNLSYTGPIEAVSSDSGWVNVLYHRREDHGLYPRGYPYAAMAETVDTGTVTMDTAVASQGLWTNVPDLDAVRILQDGDLDGQAATRMRPGDYDRDFVAARGHYLTICSMNLAFRRSIIPAFYQLPMDDNRWGVGRFDDIWSGVFLKRVCDHLGARIHNGYPLCRHDKAPRSTFDDLDKEAAGLELNEHLAEIVDEVHLANVAEPAATADAIADGGAVVDSKPTPAAFASGYEVIAGHLASGEFDRYRNGRFLNYLGARMLEWVRSLRTVDHQPLDGSCEVSPQEVS